MTTAINAAATSERELNDVELKERLRLWTPVAQPAGSNKLRSPSCASVTASPYSRRIGRVLSCEDSEPPIPAARIDT
jgi:hypothetical protein